MHKSDTSSHGIPFDNLKEKKIMKLTMDKIHSWIDDLPTEGIDRIEAYLVTLDVVPDYAAIPIKYDELKS